MEKTPAVDPPWETNPLVTNIRKQMDDDALFKSHVSIKNEISVSHLDIMLQTLLVSCSYEPHEIWHGYGVVYAQDIASQIWAGKVCEAREQMESALRMSELSLHEHLVWDIMNAQTRKLQVLALTESAHARLPYMHRNSLVRTHVLRKLRWTEPMEANVLKDSREAISDEGDIGECIFFKKVDPPVSRTIAEVRHYIHTARDDELAAFGAFMPYEEYPFAWVSYSPVARQYKRDMVVHSGADPDNSLELTRAWQADYLPRNILSMLYGFSHSYLRRFWREAHSTNLEAVITAINPNLGFTGSSFRAAGFKAVGAKATKYAFIEDESGDRHYVTRRAAAALGGEGEAPELLPSLFPLLDTHELVLNFNKRSRKQPAQPILRYADSTY